MLTIAFINPPHADWINPNVMTWLFMQSHYNAVGKYKDQINWLPAPYKYNKYENILELYEEILKDAKTVVWNGPAGVFEFSNFAAGTIGICEVLSKIDAVTIIGGGDSAAAAIQFGYADKFTHISTGGGASLEYLEGQVLPGVAAVDEL